MSAPRKKASKNSVDQILLDGELKYRNKNPFQFQHPCRIISAGRSNTGKTFNIIKKILLSKDSPFDKYIWVATDMSLEQTKLDQAKKVLKNKLVLMPYNLENLEKLKEMVKVKDKKEQWLIIFDDLINSKGSKDLKNFQDELATGGRHNNVSFCEILQQIFTGNNRKQRLQANYFVLHDFADKGEVQRLLQQIEPKNFHKLMSCYEEAVNQHDGKGCLIIDTNHHSKAEGDGLLKYRNNDLDDVFILDQ